MMIKMKKTLNGTLGLTSKEDGWENHLNLLLEDRNGMIGEPISSRKKIQKKKKSFVAIAPPSRGTMLAQAKVHGCFNGFITDGGWR